ncbi:acyl-CoA dehydrogenase family protein [Sphingobium sp. DEHP117]|uniref:acyl-CoA dehydrogenase family protein n=1 Tax=Sphingobium sp. DEHP117 TaxID=2993436 RepID=UPI0027D5FF1F|nr:acyl-CoA dehydrogenase family protein [Sphingobium sp. DEHP117]MDQ4420333.1 acyl-CoA dehydrogenase family protein [Sphingobium sp. DEHP117]
MDLTLSDLQSSILTALDSLTKGYSAPDLHDAPLSTQSETLDRELRDGGFLDVMSDPELGAVTAAIIVERISRLPVASETGASMFFGGALPAQSSSAVAVMSGARAPFPIRYLAPGTRIVVLEADRTSYFVAQPDQIRAEPESLYAYPVATLLHMPDDRATLEIRPEEAQRRWRVALAAEIAGLLRAALDSTISHVSEREQFGRKIATFQAVRHRLAQAHVNTNSTYWLAMKAAATETPEDAAMALWHAQESARNAVYDFHQFLGGMGMTLEHPLHLWTYRLKALISELGGRAGNAAAAADALWPREMPTARR